jgi:hypothetical protein
LADISIAAPAPVRAISAGYRQYAMTLLLVVYILNFIDRAVINILAEPIKNELGLLDWQIGMMSGLAFALFYTVLGLPIARYAEHGNRPRIIAVALAVWSGFTALSGMAQNFLHLVEQAVGHSHLADHEWRTAMLTTHRAFVVHLDSSSGPSARELRGRVEHIVSGRRSSLRSLQALLDFLNRFPADPRPSEETAKDLSEPEALRVSVLPQPQPAPEPKPSEASR